MTDVVCWAPECSTVIPVPSRGRHPRYCSGACRQRAVRRNGGTAPDKPYDPQPSPVASPPVRTVPPAGAVAGTTAPAPKPKRKTKRPPKPPVATFSDVPSSVGVSVTEGGASVTPGDSPPAPDPSPASPEQAAPALSIVPPAAEPELPPEPPPPSEFYLSVVAELEAIGQHESRKGRQALAIAARMESPNTSAASVGSLSKELDRFLDEMKATAPKTDDAGAIIGDRVRNKLLQASRIGAAS